MLRKPARFMVEKHTDDEAWCFRVRDLVTGETFGSGLLAQDALHLAAEHAVRLESEDAL